MADTEQPPPPPPRPATTASHSPEANPPTTPTPASIHPNAPATTANATSTSISPPAAMASSTPKDLSSSKSFRQRLDSGEKYWRWKVALRAFLIVVGIIGIGCMGFAASVAISEKMPYELSLDDGWSVMWTLITFTISVIWCAVVILVLLFRKAPVHPGVAVSMDLILWLAYIPTAMFAIVGVMTVMEWGEGGILYTYGSSGDYRQASNGTWVWSTTESTSYSSRSRYCDSRSDYGFSSTCEEQDAYVNSVWQTKNHRAGIEMAGVVCQFIGLVFHFALFVWACVDTHHRNSRKVSKDAEKLAADIVMNMVKNGAIIPPPSSTYQPPTQSPQQYLQQYQQPGFHHQQPRMLPPAGWTGPASSQVISHPSESTSEKGKAPRFA